jgi:uncharacterized protein (UPF0128 family)
MNKSKAIREFVDAILAGNTTKVEMFLKYNANNIPEALKVAAKVSTPKVVSLLYVHCTLAEVKKACIIAKKAGNISVYNYLKKKIDKKVKSVKSVKSVSLGSRKISRLPRSPPKRTPARYIGGKLKKKLNS